MDDAEKMEAAEARIQICGLGGAVRHLCGGQIAGLPERTDTGWGGGMRQSPLRKGPSGHLIVCCPLFSRVFRQEAPHEAPRLLPFDPPRGTGLQQLLFEALLPLTGWRSPSPGTSSRSSRGSARQCPSKFTPGSLKLDYTWQFV